MRLLCRKVQEGVIGSRLGPCLFHHVVLLVNGKSRGCINIDDGPSKKYG